MVSLVGVLASAEWAGAEPPPDLLGFYSGTYLSDSPGSSAQTLQLEVEKQHHRRLRVSVFAANRAEFQGRGHLLHDNVTLKMKTKATGRGAPHLILTATLDGSTVAGTYLVKQRGRPDETGIFSVSR
jgi:hypothetical protein